jgi:hypothetical protein
MEMNDEGNLRLPADRRHLDAREAVFGEHRVDALLLQVAGDGLGAAPLVALVQAGFLAADERGILSLEPMAVPRRKIVAGEVADVRGQVANVIVDEGLRGFTLVRGDDGDLRVSDQRSSRRVPRTCMWYRFCRK